MSKTLSNLLKTSGRPYFGIRYKATVVGENVQKEFVDPELATAKPYKDIPGERTFPLIGSSWTFLPLIGKYSPQRRHHASMKQYLQFGKIVRDDFSPFFKLLHLYDVQDFEKLFRYEGRYPFRVAIDSIKLYRTKRKDANRGLLAEQGTKWHEMRSKVQKHMLRPASVQYYIPGMDETSRELVQRMEDLVDSNGEIPEFMNELYKWALESIAVVALETKLGCLKKEFSKDSETWKMITGVNEAFALLNILEFSPFSFWQYRYYPSPSKKKFFKIMDFFSSIAEKYMRQALKEIEKSTDQNRESTFLENLLLKENMDMDHATAMIIDMLVAGVDTTSNSIAFSFYYLAKNQDSQQKLFQEICKVLPEPTSPITVPVLNECRYLKAVIKESMRLNPVLHHVIRALDKDIVLSGYRVPAGVIILCESFVACNLEENFPEPTKFKPERWLRGVNEEKFNPFVFLPFGFGPRSCIGKRIAEQEMWTLLIRVLQKYRLEYHYEDIDAYSRFVNVPDKPLKFKFIPR